MQTLIYKVNFAPEGIPTTVRLSQNENGRTLQFVFIGDRITIPDGSVVTISGTKPDGHVYSAEGTLDGDVATFDEEIQMTAAAGEWAAKLKVTHSGLTVATQRLWMIIDADTVLPGSVPSESELNGLVAEAQQYAENARSAAYGSPLTAALEADMLDTSRVYVYTGSETGMIFGHWYYYEDGAWEDGGVYQSQGVQTDTTLSIPGMPADAGAAGDALAGKVNAEAGKGLSSNDFTTAEKTKLAGIADQATRVLVDNTLKQSGQAADSKIVGDEIDGLKEDLSDLEDEMHDAPKGLISDAEDVDLDITDPDGNVLARFSGGDIQTKNFSSSKILGCKLTNATDVDLDIVDPVGNVLLRLEDGEIKTKNFDSSDIIANGYLKGKVIVNFGDSIFGNKRPPNDISTAIANATGATVYNCGFGGCRMAKFDYSGRNTWGKFSMFELATAIATGTWTDQDAAVADASWTGMPAYFPETLALLKSIDFSEVDIVTIAYGTNDFTGAVPLDNANDNLDTTSFAGALRYSIETLLTAFPNLRIICCGQCYRWWDNSGEFVDDSNTHEVNGQLLTQFVSKTEDVAEEYNLQFINNYNIGIGKYTRGYYFSGGDTTHPNNIGTNLIAKHIVKELY